LKETGKNSKTKTNMALKRKTKDITEIPEAARGLYKETGDGDDKVWVLQNDFIPEGMTPKEKLDEFRNSNLALKSQNEDLIKKFGNIDLEAYNKAVEQQRLLEEKELLKKGDVDAIVESRVKEMKELHSQEIQKVSSERDTAASRLQDLEINQVVMSAATSKKALTGALPDIISRAKTVFVYKEGSILPMKDGQTWYGPDGVTPITIPEWVDRLSVEAAHLFQNSTGSGASNHGSAGVSGHPKLNPYKKGKGWNLTKQGQLEQSNPSLASQLRKEAELAPS